MYVLFNIKVGNAIENFLVHNSQTNKFEMTIDNKQ